VTTLPCNFIMAAQWKWLQEKQSTRGGSGSGGMVAAQHAASCASSKKTIKVLK